MPRGLLIGLDLGQVSMLTVALGSEFEIRFCSSVTDGVSTIEAGLEFVIFSERSGTDGAIAVFMFAHPTCHVLVVSSERRLPISTEVPSDVAMSRSAPLEDVIVRLSGLFRDTALHLTSSRHGRRALAHISRHFSKDLSLESTAHAVGISASRLAHVLPSETGYSFKEFLIRVRLEAAKRLLIETDATVDAVAERVGFYDAAHLSRLFRRETGRGPGAYRRSIGKARRGVADTG